MKVFLVVLVMMGAQGAFAGSLEERVAKLEAEVAAFKRNPDYGKHG